MLVLVVSDWGFWSSVIGSEESEEVKGLLFGFDSSRRFGAFRGAAATARPQVVLTAQLVNGGLPLIGVLA